MGTENAAIALSSLTITDFLRMPITIQSMPVVLTGEAHLGRRIRWLHVMDLTDTGGLLQGGELILTTGIALPQSADEMAKYIASLADQGVAGLVIEIGRRFAEVPPAMVRACARQELPLIVLRREVPFVRMTEAAHSVIINGQQRLLQVTAAAHVRFTEMSTAGGTVDELVHAAGDLAEGQIVFSNLMHHVIALDPRDGRPEELLTRWRRRAFPVHQIFGTLVDEAEGMVITPVEVRGQQRGLLVLFSPTVPTPTQVMVVERAAAALTIRLLVEDDEVLISNARRMVLTDIIARKFVSAEAMHARTAALGHPTLHRQMLPVVVYTDRPDMADLIREALHHSRLDSLAGHLGAGRWGVLLLLKPDQAECHSEAFAKRLHELCGTDGVGRPAVAKGGLVTSLGEVGRSFAEADEVAVAARAAEPFTEVKACYGIQDIRLRGLLFTLRNDSRLQSFVERTLGPLLARDARDGGEWVRTAAVYLKLRGNKSIAAQELGISRPTLYERLARIERLLQVDLDDPESSTSLYAAIMLAEVAPESDPAGIPDKPRGASLEPLTLCQEGTLGPDSVRMDEPGGLK